jgi:hypothetical protein
VLGAGVVPVYETAKQLVYTRAVIDETLRYVLGGWLMNDELKTNNSLFPPVPVDPKTAVADDVLPSGLHVPAGVLNTPSLCLCV